MGWTPSLTLNKWCSVSQVPDERLHNFTCNEKKRKSLKKLLYIILLLILKIMIKCAYVDVDNCIYIFVHCAYFVHLKSGYPYVNVLRHIF